MNITVKDFNEFIQFGFPKGCCLDGDAHWYDMFEDQTCELTGKLLLPDDFDITVQAESLFLEPEEENNDIGFISVAEAIALYQDLKAKPQFKVGDNVAIVSEVAFLPDYWIGFEHYTSYWLNLTVVDITDSFVSLSYVDEGQVREMKTSKYSITGFKIQVVSQKMPGKCRAKFAGYTLDYANYIVSQTAEIEQAAAKVREAQSTARELYLIAGELLNGASFHPGKASQLLAAKQILLPLLNQTSKLRINLT